MERRAGGEGIDEKISLEVLNTIEEGKGDDQTEIVVRIEEGLRKTLGMSVDLRTPQIYVKRVAPTQEQFYEKAGEIAQWMQKEGGKVKEVIEEKGREIMDVVEKNGNEAYRDIAITWGKSINKEVVGTMVERYGPDLALVGEEG